MVIEGESTTGGSPRGGSSSASAGLRHTAVPLLPKKVVDRSLRLEVLLRSAMASTRAPAQPIVDELAMRAQNVLRGSVWLFYGPCASCERWTADAFNGHCHGAHGQGTDARYCAGTNAAKEGRLAGPASCSAPGISGCALTARRSALHWPIGRQTAPTTLAAP
ncbi:hypothetical protein FQR65_LT21007 [Abscondita terminalis]|nr:hypothetical protein FQR65_LT21007 [Abscondita terminalis]